MRRAPPCETTQPPSPHRYGASAADRLLLHARNLLADHRAVDAWRIQGFLRRLDGRPFEQAGGCGALTGGFAIVRTKAP